MHTIEPEISSKPPPRRRRFHSEEFKADAVAAASQPGMSMAAVALARGINANLLRRWARDAEPAGGGAERPTPGSPQSSASSSAAPAFLPVPLPGPNAAATPTGDIRVELRRGSMTVVVTWPSGLAIECGAWLRELVR